MKPATGRKQIFDLGGWMSRVSGVLARARRAGLNPGFARLVAKAADFHCENAGYDVRAMDWRELVVTGRAMELDQTAPGDLRLSVGPREANGWRSEYVAKRNGAAAIRVELVGSPNGSDGKGRARTICAVARAIHQACSGAGGREAARTNDLHRIGNVDRRLFDSRPLEPNRIVKVGDSEPRDSFGGQGVGSLLAILQMFSTSEATVSMRGRFRLEPHLKRLHLLEAVEPETAIGISTEPVLGTPRSPASLPLRTCARRLRDGATVGLSETVLR